MSRMSGSVASIGKDWRYFYTFHALYKETQQKGESDWEIFLLKEVTSVPIAVRLELPKKFS